MSEQNIKQQKKTTEQYVLGLSPNDRYTMIHSGALNEQSLRLLREKCLGSTATEGHKQANVSVPPCRAPWFSPGYELSTGTSLSKWGLYFLVTLAGKSARDWF